MHPDPDADPPPLGLRDRQRAAVRADLRRAGYRLFVERGYDNVSVEDITAAAAVSRRTFFRHVAGKEDLLLGPVRRGGAAVARELEAQPSRIAPDRALVNAIVARADAFEEADSQDWRAALLSAPDLVDKVTMLDAPDRDRIVKSVAARMLTDAATDPRPGLLVQLAFAAGDYGFRQWVRQPSHATVELRQWVADSLHPVLNRHWRAAPR